MPSPIALFVFARPEHTRQTLAALAANDLAEQSDLVVFADAARNEGEVDRVRAVREVVRSAAGFRSVTVIEREVNYGLARNIIEGVTEVCDRHGRVIVLEDDLVTSPYFLRYMNDALDFYRDEESVMHISGSAYPVGSFEWRHDTYFLNVPLCWGWGTWQRAWSLFEKDLAVIQNFDAAMIRAFNFGHTYNYWRQLELNQTGRINTWFIFWYAQLFLRKGLSFFPVCSLVQNIGHDGSGVHCGATNLYDMELSKRPISVDRIPLEVSHQAFEAHKRYFRRVSPGLATRVFNRLKRLARGT